MTTDVCAERPQKLPFSATFVIWASKELTDAEKIVWFHDWALDQGGADAAYMSPRSLGQRIAKEPKTIEQYRGRLRRLGLHESLRRRDARNLGWIATLPPECVPRGGPIAGEEGVRLAVLLDAHIRGRDDWLRQGSRSDRDDHLEESEIPVSGRGRQASRPNRGTDRDTAGGKGGSPTSAMPSEAQLQPGVTEVGSQDGAGALAPKEVGGQDGKPKRLKPSEQPPEGEWLALQEEMRRRRTEREAGGS